MSVWVSFATHAIDIFIFYLNLWRVCFFTIQTIKYDYLALKIYGSWSKEFKLVDSIAMKKIIKLSEIKSQLNREMDRTTMIHRSNPSTFHGGYANYIFGDLSPMARAGRKWMRVLDGGWRCSTCLMFSWVGILWPLSEMDLRKANGTAYDVILTCLFEEKMYR